MRPQRLWPPTALRAPSSTSGSSCTASQRTTAATPTSPRPRRSPATSRPASDSKRLRGRLHELVVQVHSARHAHRAAGRHRTLGRDPHHGDCQGAGCPFAHRAMTVSARGKCGKHARRGCVAAPSFNLASIFHRAHLGVGTRVAVAVTHRGWVGKYYRFTIRKGHKPSIDVSCLAVNGTRPGVGCSAR